MTKARQRQVTPNDVEKVFAHIWEDGMPQVLGADDELKRLSKAPKLYFCVKNYAYSPVKSNITYYRDSNAKEIDVFVEENGIIHPLEIKKSATPNSREVKKFAFLDKTAIRRGNGGLDYIQNTENYLFVLFALKSL